jgi:ankyrin repeat protein
MCAARSDCPETVQALLAAGANPRIKHKEGDTALRLAIQAKNTRSSALLRKAGAKE